MMRLSHTGTWSRTAGFTLIELMIAVGVIAVLTTLATSSYQYAMAKADRATAISDINEIAQTLERFYTYNRVYTNYFGDLAMGADNSYSIDDPSDRYTYSIGVPNTQAPATVPQAADQTGQSYVLYANPKNSRDTWILSQNEHGFQQRYSSESATAKTGWP